MAPQKTSYGELLLNNRLIVLVALLILTFVGTFGAKNLYFDNDYRSFFGDTNPQLEAFEKLQRTYTKIDNVQFAIDPESGKANSLKVLAAIEDLTEMSWQIPYSIRVDSLSNYQHTEVEGDDLIVRDLYFDAANMSAD